MAVPVTLTGPRRVPVPRHLADLTPQERRQVLAELGHRPFRASQLGRHYFGHLSADPTTWTDIPYDDRASLAQALLPQLLAGVRHLEADEGATRKSVWRLHDGALIESVLMRYLPRRSGAGWEAGRLAELGEADDADDADDAGSAGTSRRRARATVCVSSQAGCGMACPFCATGQAGLTRNLSTAEIVEQVVAAARALRQGELPGGPGRLSNVVFMGMGEPLANYRAVLAALRVLAAPLPDGLGLSARALTVSTVGLVPAIDALAGEGLPVTLALSLHAPDDARRNELVPVNARWPVAEALDAARRYAQRTSRRVSIEYALIRDVNDQAWRADLLADLLTARGRGWVHVNPIPLNPTPGSRWTASAPDVAAEFVRRLRARGVTTTVRDTRGREIDGACGQLAATVEEV